MAENQTNVTEEQNEERGPLQIKVDEHEAFNPIMDCKLIPATTFGKLIDQVFKTTFDDHIGVRYRIDQASNRLMYTIVCDTNERLTEGSGVYACTKVIDTGTTNKVLNRIRTTEQRYQRGDRWSITEDGRNALAPFLFSPQDMNWLYDRAGHVRWDRIIAPVASDVNSPFNTPRTPLNEISYLDPDKLAALIWGEVNDTGKWVYVVKVMSSVPRVTVVNGQIMTDYMLQINRISEDRTLEMAQLFGLQVNMNPLNIIRSGK